MDPKGAAIVRAYHSERMSRFGVASARALGWRDAHSQRQRFEQIAEIGNLNGRTGTSINIGSDLAGLGSLSNNRAKSIDSKLTATNFTVSNDKGLEISGFTVHSSTTNELEEQIDRTYVSTNAVENTSEFSLQENELDQHNGSINTP